MIKEKIRAGKTFLGIELGSTRIKASLIDDTYSPLASGFYEWENQFQNGYWTYSLERIHEGLAACFQNLTQSVYTQYHIKLQTVGAIGVSAMMHGYLAFDAENNLLTPFRTWRNTTTKAAADALTAKFSFNIPQRWSVAHLYQAILNGEAHTAQIAHITTLAGYVHFLLTGRWELGIGDASGMFPIRENAYNPQMLSAFDKLITPYHLPWHLLDILPCIRCAGEKGAFLTEAGAKFLDPTGTLQPGIPLCPPEGDAGTGMVATNSVLPKTGNISAGTSIFAMLVLEKELKNVYPQIDLVTTPDGHSVAMVHCNNCCNELDAWVSIFDEFATLIGAPTNKGKLYELLYQNAMEGNCNGITSYNYLSGEHTTGIANGRPMYFRLPEAKMGLASFMKAQLFSSVATLSIGIDMLFKKENVSADRVLGHGGLFKVPDVAQNILASALNTAISVLDTAGEGGAWGMALLAAYMCRGNGQTLGRWLDAAVFANCKETVAHPDVALQKEFEQFLAQYKAGLCAERMLEEIKPC